MIMIGQNDGVANEKLIENALNEHSLSHVSKYYQAFIKQMFDNASDSEIIHAKRVGGQGYKPDLEIEIAGKKHLISVKKGGGNSVHQEKTALFIMYCIQELGMTEKQRDSLLAFLYGDGTLDGDSLPEERLKDQELVSKYREEISIVQDFFDQNKRSLIERFLVYGRRGVEDNIKADYLYHGDDTSGVWCPLDYNTIDYLVELPNSKDAPLSIGPMTVQVWNRNLDGKPEMEARRHSIQVKWGSCKTHIEAINKRHMELVEQEKKNTIQNTNRKRDLGNNKQGFENQDNLIDLLDGNRSADLPIALKSIISSMFPHIAATELIHAGKVTGNDVKPRLYVSVNGITKYLTVFMGSGNSVHQEKLDNFLDYCKKELDITETEIKALLTIMYGDGTLDGKSKSENRLKSTDEVKHVYPTQVEIAQAFFNRNKKELIERFLIYGKGGKTKGISTDFIYYGTDVTGRIASKDTVIKFLLEKTPSDSALLSLGSLTTQPWNRNPEAKVNLEDRRHSLQIKWGGIKQDLSKICDAEEEKNIGTTDGNWDEYELVSKLNRDRKEGSKLWSLICENLGIYDLTDVYAVRVTSMVYSKLSDRPVLPKADVYLVKGKFRHELLLDNNYWIDEDSIKDLSYKVIPYSGISCKRVNSKSFTYAKFTINTFDSLFGDRILGAAISLFVKGKDVELNNSVLEKWAVQESEMIAKYASDIETKSNITITNVDVAECIKHAAIKEITSRIKNEPKLSNAIFFGRDIFEEPYSANYIYMGGEIYKSYIPSFSVTTGSGRHKGNFTIVIKP